MDRELLSLRSSDWVGAILDAHRGARIEILITRLHFIRSMGGVLALALAGSRVSRPQPARGGRSSTSLLRGHVD